MSATDVTVYQPVTHVLVSLECGHEKEFGFTAITYTYVIERKIVCDACTLAARYALLNAGRHVGEVPS
jgi:hypothetical protein